MKIAFYKSTSPSAQWYDKLVSIWTGSVYSHVEIIFSSGLSFSSSPRDGGCRFKAIVYDDSSWDYIVPKDMSPEIEARMLAFCDSQNGKGYDWLGIFLSQLLPLKIEDPNRWFCSEVAARMLGYQEPSSYNPKILNLVLKGEYP